MLLKQLLKQSIFNTVFDLQVLKITNSLIEPDSLFWLLEILKKKKLGIMIMYYQIEKA